MFLRSGIPVWHTLVRKAPLSAELQLWFAELPVSVPVMPQLLKEAHPQTIEMVPVLCYLLSHSQESASSQSYHGRDCSLKYRWFYCSAQSLLTFHLLNTSSLWLHFCSFTWAPSDSKGSRNTDTGAMGLEGIWWLLRGLRVQCTFPVKKYWCFGVWRQPWGRCPLRIYWGVSGRDQGFTLWIEALRAAAGSLSPTCKDSVQQAHCLPLSTPLQTNSDDSCFPSPCAEVTDFLLGGLFLFLLNLFRTKLNAVPTYKNHSFWFKRALSALN